MSSPHFEGCSIQKHPHDRSHDLEMTVHERLHIEENSNIESVLHIIDKLNRDSVAKYRYMGQSVYSLAYAYYTKRFDKNIVSYCSPQVYYILKDNINSPFLEFYKK